MPSRILKIGMALLAVMILIPLLSISISDIYARSQEFTVDQLVQRLAGYGYTAWASGEGDVIIAGDLDVQGGDTNIGDRVLADTGSQLTIDGIAVPRTATIVVAASGAPAAIIAQADYVVTGTSDDEINAAYGLLSAGDSLCLMGDDFTIAAALELDTAGTAIYAMPGTTITLANGLNDNGIEVTADNVHIYGFNIDGNYSGVAGCNYVMLVDSVSGFYSDRLTITDAYQEALALKSVSDSAVENFCASGSGDDAIAMWDCHQIQINGTNIDLGRSAVGTSSCIEIEDDVVQASSDGITIDGLTANNPSSHTSGYGVNIVVNNDYPMKDVTISNSNFNDLPMAITSYGGTADATKWNEAIIIDNCTFRECGYTASSFPTIYMRYSIGCAVLDSTIIDSKEHGIYFRTAGTDNKVCDTFISGSTRSGIYNRDVSRSTISNNTVKNNDQSQGGYVAINLRDSSYNIVDDNQCYDDQGTPTQDYGVLEQGTSDDNSIQDNIFSGNTIAQMLYIGSNNIVRDNIGFTTENSGTDTVASGTTSKVVTHGLDITPDLNKLKIVGLEDPTSSVGTIWCSNATSTQFTVNVENDPGASNWDFGWSYAD